MFGSIGMPELVVIFIVALLVFGPKKLPEIGKSIGKGLAEFKRASDDLKKTIVLKGTVTEFVWSNPHAQIYFDAKDAQGNVRHWGGETFAPSTLTRTGWTKKTLKPGDEITITVFPSKAGSSFGLVSSVVLADGQKFVPVSPETASTRTDGEQ